MASPTDLAGKPEGRADARPAPSPPARSSGPLARRSSGLWRWWARIETGLTGLLVGGALALVFYTVLLRYVAPAYAPHVTEELTVYIVMWAVLLACGRVTREREHVRADLVFQLMPRPWQRACDILANLAGVGFALFLAYYGGLVAYEAWDFGDLSATQLRFPLWIYYSALPVAALLIAIGHLRVAFALTRGAPPDQHEAIPPE